MQLKNLKTNFLGRNIFYYKTIDSTQKEIWRRVDDDKIENGTLIFADIQTGGIGTHGRIWHTDEKNNIAFSFYLKLNCDIITLSGLTKKIAEIGHRPPCPVRIVNLPHRTFGGYNPETKTIDINSIYVKMSDVDKMQFREVIDTLIHEGRHAYQDYNVNVCEVHPRHSEVISWAETMEGGKWGYHGDVSTKLGQRLYEQQSIEIDARNFAADVLDKFEQKQTV